MTTIKAPMNYIGNKYRLMPQIKRWFPHQINLMVDLFCGGCDVTFNTAAKRHIANDLNFFVVDIYREFQRLGIADAMKRIDKIIADWGLSKTNQAAYEAFRTHYNRTRQPLDLYALMCHSFNYQFRFNSAHEYNNPFGRNRSSFNDKLRQRLIELQPSLQTVRYTSCDFREFDYSVMHPGDFLYADPPYLITCGSYNDGKRGFKGWSETDERDLYAVLDRLDRSGIRFALSNVLQHKGKHNNILLDWQRERRYHVHKVRADYANCNYHAKRDSSLTCEVLITNY